MLPIFALIALGLIVLALAGLRDRVIRLECLAERNDMKVSELNARLTQAETVLTKVQAEVQALKDSAADADLPPETVAALDRISALIGSIDAINPDSTAPTEPTPEG
jgi:uncharacterized coiled-coil protein SlyX